MHGGESMLTTSAHERELARLVHEVLSTLADEITEREVAALRAAVFQAAELETIDSHDKDDASERWVSIVATISLENARLISSALTVLCERVTQQRRNLNREDTNARDRLRDAIGFLYTDVMRPLWRAFPELEPPEVKIGRVP
jgi:hypothetical protein